MQPIDCIAGCGRTAPHGYNVCDAPERVIKAWDEWAKQNEIGRVTEDDDDSADSARKGEG